ncbi:MULTISPECIES: 50S ribosomal protein L25/general stress protein Ctc [unclassified Brevundimonas]|uniref:50S ribosomal protein L25/general stress protein Ctc n=1 Tax=unclassified Brevundimonas TaxID=2622653 RepID=UPI0025C44E6C|nr:MULTISPECIES: 50S ribosomal protein L25/general stress protein Ctc [unclassified Brevundimonas]
MAEIILNVDVREGVGTGSARAVRRAGAVPGILYGGDKAPVAISVSEREFRKSLYTGKLLGHLVTLKYGEETQPVIAKTVDFDPVTDRPLHFDLMRVDETAPVKISLPVQFINADEAPFVRQGGTLEVVRHEVEVMIRADQMPSAFIIDLAKVENDTNIRFSDITNVGDAQPTITDRDFMIASVKSSAGGAEEEAASEEAEG